MTVIHDLTDEEAYLVAILQDESGVDAAEFLWVDERSDDGLFRCYDYQIPWWRCTDGRQIDMAGRDVGKSLGVQARAFVFPFNNPGEEMLVTAPELVHLNPLAKGIEDRLMDCRLTREMLRAKGPQKGIVHRPFEARFVNGAKIIGRIPQRDGKGVKGTHAKKVELDEGQDYGDAGWTEIIEAFKMRQEGAAWRAHGVTRGVRDFFYRFTQPGSGWTVHRITSVHRPDWDDRQREAKAEMFGGAHTPDYRRNIMGLHGDAQSPLFVLSRLMGRVDSDQNSDYNIDEYNLVRIVDEEVALMPDRDITPLVKLPVRHLTYERTWVGVDFGLTNHPTEILVFGEYTSKEFSEVKTAHGLLLPASGLRLLSRYHLERISSPDQRAVLELIYDFYRPQVIALDGTGLGLPIYQEIIGGDNEGLKTAVESYNFSSKVVVGYEDIPEDADIDEYDQYAIKANVLEYASDLLRLMVDSNRIILPWDRELIGEWQGQTYRLDRSSTSPYGKRVFNRGAFHTLDGGRMAAISFVLRHLGIVKPQRPEHEAIMVGWAS